MRCPDIYFQASNRAHQRHLEDLQQYGQPCTILTIRKGRSDHLRVKRRPKQGKGSFMEPAKVRNHHMPYPHLLQYFIKLLIYFINLINPVLFAPPRSFTSFLNEKGNKRWLRYTILHHALSHSRYIISQKHKLTTTFMYPTLCISI